MAAPAQPGGVRGAAREGHGAAVHRHIRQALPGLLFEEGRQGFKKQPGSTRRRDISHAGAAVIRSTARRPSSTVAAAGPHSTSATRAP